MPRRLKLRAGFSLAELIVAVTILSIVGAGMMRVLVNQNRFYDQQTNLRSARSIARNSMNILLSDLRMVQDSGGVDSATSDFKTMRVIVPYRFGLACGVSGTTTIASMAPIDSATNAMAVYKGFAVRNAATGRYALYFPNAPTGADAPTTSSSPATCTGSGAGQAQIKSMALNGRTADILDLKSSTATGAVATAPVFLFQRVTYSFKASQQYPSYLGLWRNVDGANAEELMAPFDTSAGFRYYVQGSEGAQATVPALANIRGVDVLLYSLSPRTTSNSSKPSPSKMVTSVFFKNVRNY
jgi:prepilin-type N-terminal cleavage/methylation domain-containing protein